MRAAAPVPGDEEPRREAVLVTGGVGFVGSHVTEALLREGRRVVVYDSFNSETTKTSEKGRVAGVLRNVAEEGAGELVIVPGDVRDRAALEDVVKKERIAACVHVGGMVDDRRSVRYPEEYIDVNIRGTATLLDVLGRHGVKHVVQASTRSVFGECADAGVALDENAPRRPINPYGASKVASDAMAHCYAHLHHMNVTVIRIFATYGPRGRPDMIPRILVQRVASGEPVTKFGDGSATRCFTYISDIVEAFMAALRRPQLGYVEFNTGSVDGLVSLNEMIATAERVFGKRAVIHQGAVPPGDAHTVGHPDWAKIEKVLGWRPRVSLEEGMTRLHEWVQSQELDRKRSG